MEFDLTLGLWLGLGATCAALCALVAVSLVRPARPAASESLFQDGDEGAVFLFDGDTLVDASPGARRLLSMIGGDATPWQRLIAFLSPRFPDMEARLATLPSSGNLSLAPTDPAAVSFSLQADWRGGLTRVRLTDRSSTTTAAEYDSLALRALEDEVSNLRSVVASTPALMWQENPAGEVMWANRAYLTALLGNARDDLSLIWPLPRLFQDLPAPKDGVSREQIDLRGKPHWFDVTRIGTATATYFFATSADAAVQAEHALRDFMQTLTKTFAHLSIGLAIFDKQRRLALFNPALLDLTTLGPEFLSARPLLFDFLDALRERRMIPEPKNYKDWRKEMTALEKAAASGQFEEVWPLPNGQTYRVIGRPHPDGAMALIFEDISTETTQARRFRAEVELGQAVIDAMEEAVVVFSPAGTLMLSNTAYGDLWGNDLSDRVVGPTLASQSTVWRTASAPSGFWAQVEDFVAAFGPREMLEDQIRMLDGRLLDAQCRRLAGGATMLGFRVRHRPRTSALPQAGVAQAKSA